MFRPFPADLLGTDPQGTQGRRGARAARPAAGRRPAADARDPRHGQQVPGERPRAASTRAYPALADLPRRSRTRRRSTPARSAWAAATCSPRASSARSRTCCPTASSKRLFYLSIDFLRDEPITPEAGDLPADDRGGLPARAASWRCAARENPNLMPDGQHHGALPLGRRLGRDHHRQEPGDDAVRPARLPHQGQPEVRLGEEGPADDLLPVGRAGADPHQLRVLLRRRGALARSERVPPHQRAGRPEGRRRLHHPERPAVARTRSGRTSRPRSRRSSSTRRSRSSTSTRFKIAREEATDPDLQLRMQGIAFQGAFFAASPVMEQAGLDEARLLEAIREPARRRSSAPRARASSRTTCAWSSAASTSCARSPPGPITRAAGRTARAGGRAADPGDGQAAARRARRR